jgi:cell division protein FtsB
MIPTFDGNLKDAILEFLAEFLTKKEEMDRCFHNLQVHNRELRERNKELEEQIEKLRAKKNISN